MPIVRKLMKGKRWIAYDDASIWPNMSKCIENMAYAVIIQRSRSFSPIHSVIWIVDRIHTHYSRCFGQ